MIMCCGTGFNRYIVECKWFSFQDWMNVSRDLIDTQWNVNNDNAEVKALFREDLIDTQWNVNELT